MCGHFIDDPKKITGAGVLLIEENYHGRGPAVILFRDRFTKRYNDGGGARDAGENIFDTARRELKEESCNLFRLTRASVATAEHVQHGPYVGFFIFVRSNNGIQSKSYFKNLKELQRIGAPKEWRETDNMKRVYLADIDVNVLNEQGHVDLPEAVTKKPITIEGKTKALLRRGFEQEILSRDFSVDYIDLVDGGGERTLPLAKLVSYYDQTI